MVFNRQFSYDNTSRSTSGYIVLHNELQHRCTQFQSSTYFNDVRMLCETLHVSHCLSLAPLSPQHQRLPLQLFNDYTGKCRQSLFDVFKKWRIQVTNATFKNAFCRTTEVFFTTQSLSGRISLQQLVYLMFVVLAWSSTVNVITFNISMLE